MVPGARDVKGVLAKGMLRLLHLIGDLPGALRPVVAEGEGEVNALWGDLASSTPPTTPT